GAIGESPERVVPALLAVLDPKRNGGKPSSFLRSAACAALGKFEVDAEDVVPALVALLGDSDLAVRQTAVRTLHEMGPEAGAAAPALLVLAERADFRAEA